MLKIKMTLLLNINASTLFKECEAAHRSSLGQYCTLYKTFLESNIILLLVHDIYMIYWIFRHLQQKKPKSATTCWNFVYLIMEATLVLVLLPCSTNYFSQIGMELLQPEMRFSVFYYLVLSWRTKLKIDVFPPMLLYFPQWKA